MKSAILELGADEVRRLVAYYSTTWKIPSDVGTDIICEACLANPELAPEKRYRLASDRVMMWVNGILKGYNSRPSVWASKMPGTLPDSAIEDIVCAALPHLDSNTANSLVWAHRLCMSAENILGKLLEEYIAIKLRPYGWACAWGESIRAVDFCSSDGTLLQVKNRSNTENSSSNKIRKGTNIKHWFRVNASNGQTEWRTLCHAAGVGNTYLSEEDFREFIKTTLKHNPKALAVEDRNPWGSGC